MSNRQSNIAMTCTHNRRFEPRLVRPARRPDFLAGLSLLASALLLVFGCLGLSACGGGNGSGATTVKSVSITASSTSTPVNGQITFTAVVNLNNSTTSTTTTVSWEVNGVAGGSGSCGSIVAFATDQLEATYTAPPSVPTSSCGASTQLGEVAVTAVATQTGTSSTSTSASVTSNTVIVTIGNGLGLALSPTSTNVPAGGTQQFTAFLNSVPTAAAWTLSSTSNNGGNLGSIDGTGLYTAPPFPPPGASVTVTATVTETDGSVVTATATALIAYSDHSLSGPYAFSYRGNDAAGFLAAAGSFVTDGNGKIISGVEDVQSSLTGTSKALLITNKSTYSVGGDGRGTASIVTSKGTETWSFVLSTNQHGEMIRFDTNNAGGGSIDQQSLGALANSVSAISGSYAFSLIGLDGSQNPLGMAGEVPAGGTVATPVIDVNDNGSAGGTVTRAGAVLSAGFAVDTVDPSTGRGTFTLQAAPICSVAPGCTFAYYAVGTTTNSSDAVVVSQLHLVEIDGIASLAGDLYLAATTPGLADATYVFKAGGSSSAGAFAAGGVFASDGVGTTSNGTIDIDDAGTYNSGATLGSCTFTVNSTTGRVDLELFAGSGTCTGPGSGVSEFAAYPTALGSVVLLELDSSAVSAGIAFQQCGPQSAGCSGAASPTLTAASLAIGLTGQGLFHVPPATSGAFQSDLDGEINLSGLNTSGGKLDINNFGAVFQGDPLGTTGNSLGSPASSGRGTATLTATNPSATYNLVYYLVDNQTALLFSSSASSNAIPVAVGTVLFQF
jgi:hypothetical protein